MSDTEKQLQDLSASLRAMREDHEAVLAELRLLRQEVEALRDELGAALVARQGSPQREEPAAPAGPPRPAPGDRRSWRERLIAVPRLVLARAWVVALVVTLLVGALGELGALAPVEVLADYARQWFRPGGGGADVQRRIAVVTIDEASLAALGPWGRPWRVHHGRLLRALADDGARAVGFDIYVSAPSPEHDAALADGIAYARARGTGVVIGRQYDDQLGRLGEPAPSVRASGASFGSTYLRKDRVTNLVRYVPMFQRETLVDGPTASLVPALSLAVALAGGHHVEEFRRYRDSPVTIDFAGPASSFRAASYVDVHAGRVPPGTFRDAYVVVGVTFAAAKDFFDTPVETQMPGVFIHASALYTLLRGAARPLPAPGALAVLLAAACLAALVSARTRGTVRAGLLLLLVVAYGGVALALEAGRPPLHLELVPVTLAVGLVWGAATTREKIAAFGELRRAMGLPDKAFRRLERDRAFQRGVLEKRVTVLASDVRGYSVLSHAHSPTYVRAIMAEYQQMAERVIYRHGGYVNKFVGDAVLAIFGYPMDEARHAERAVQAAVEMQQGLATLTERWRRQGREGISGVRIGINTGAVNVSFLGSSKKQLDVMGDNVDLAARLEAAAGHVDCIALLSLDTHREVTGWTRGRVVRVELKNRPDVTEAYALEDILAPLESVAEAGTAAVKIP